MILPVEGGADAGLLLRAWRPADADALANAMRDSRAHLAPWMGFANDPPEAAADQLVRIHRWEQDRLAGRDGVYGMFLDGEVVGGCGLHRRLAPDGLEIGYWVHARHTGRGICTRAARLLTDLAFRDDMIGRVEIHHDAANLASGAVPRKLGFRKVGESPRARMAPADSGVEWRWRVRREEWFAPAGGHFPTPGAPADGHDRTGGVPDRGPGVPPAEPDAG